MILLVEIVFLEYQKLLTNNLLVFLYHGLDTKIIALEFFSSLFLKFLSKILRTNQLFLVENS